MDIRQNPLWLSIPCQQFFRAEIRISLWYLLVAALLLLNLGWKIGLAVSLILLASLIIHELAHVLAARQTGGSGYEILIWPLGGLAFASPGPTFFSEAVTILAGPLANGLICLCCLPLVWSSGYATEAMSLLRLPPVDLNNDILSGLVLLAFSVNWKLLVINALLPIYPLDCGQFVYACGKIYWEKQTAKLGSLWVGMIASLLLMFVGWYWKSFDVILLASILMAMCQYEFVVAQVSRSREESFLGYDFSQGYTSLEEEDEHDAVYRPSMFERWKQEREEKKREKEQLLKLETDRRVDELLEKIHLHGKISLTADEQRFLEQASNRYRSQGKE